MKKIWNLTLILVVIGSITGCVPKSELDECNTKLETVSSELEACKRQAEEKEKRFKACPALDIDLLDPYTSFNVIKGSLVVQYNNGGTPSVCTFDIETTPVVFVKNYGPNKKMRVKISSGKIPGANATVTTKIDTRVNKPWIAGVVVFDSSSTSADDLRFIGIEDVRGYASQNDKANPKGTFIDFLDSRSGVEFSFDGADKYTANWINQDVTGNVSGNYEHKKVYKSVVHSDPGKKNELELAARFYYSKVFY